MRSLTFLARRQGRPRPTNHRSPSRRAHGAGRAEGIASTVSAWLAELGARSPLVEDLARTVRDGEWAAVYATADCLSVDVTVAA